jgi:hypothetical protein
VITSFKDQTMVSDMTGLLTVEGAYRGMFVFLVQIVRWLDNSENSLCPCLPAFGGND